MPNEKNHLKNAIATALSLDHWTAPPESLCDFDDKRLSVNFLCMDQPANGADKTFIKRAARYQEIFLDLTAWYASLKHTPKIFLDDRFHSNLSDNEQKLKDDLLVLIGTHHERLDNKCEAYMTILNFLRDQLGLGKDLDKALSMRLTRIGEKTNITFESNPWPNPDTDHTELIQDILKRMTTQPNLLRAAAMSGVLQNNDTFYDLNDDERREVLVNHSDVLEKFLIENSCLNQGYRWKKAIEHARMEVIHDLYLLFNPDPSHVFVCNTSVCQLACDAFLCPVSKPKEKGSEMKGNIWEQWKEKAEKWNLASNIFMIKDRVAVPTHWPEKCPLVIPTRIRKDRDVKTDDARVDDLIKSARQFLEAAYSEVKKRGKGPLHGRERYLFALPILGTGRDSEGKITGGVIGKLLKELYQFVAKTKVDCVIVVADEETYVDVQSKRLEPTSILTDEKIEAAKNLAEIAELGHLSLFLGAGTSIPSGLPSWKGLLEKIAKQLPSGLKIYQKLESDLPKLAEILGNACGNLKEQVANIIKQERDCLPSLLLTLVLSLKTKAIVTTNYDELIEIALRNRNVAKGAPSDISIYPCDHCDHSNRKEKILLKMHGCVCDKCDPGKIVLSHTDYNKTSVWIRIFQAKLLETHILFCGFSLTDPNYQAVLKEVREDLSKPSNVAGNNR